MRYRLRTLGGVIQVTLTDRRRLWIGVRYIRRIEQDEQHTNVELDSGEVLKITEHADRFADRINKPVIIEPAGP